jgi:hypothetical protein
MEAEEEGKGREAEGRSETIISVHGLHYFHVLGVGRFYYILDLTSVWEWSQGSSKCSRS